MADRLEDDNVSVHQEDSTSSGGPSSTHNPIERCLFLETNPNSTTLAVVPITTTSTPMATVVGGVPTYVANIGIPTTIPHAENQPLPNLQNLPAGAVVQWSLANNSIPSQDGQSIPPCPNNCYTQFHTPYYPQYPGYGASVPVTLFPGNHVQTFPTYPPISPSLQRGALSIYRPAIEINPTLRKEQPQPIIPPPNRQVSTNRDEPYIPENRPPSSYVHRENPQHSQTHEYSRTHDSSPVYRGAYVMADQIEKIVWKQVEN
jgi:hypothetical protein